MDKVAIVGIEMDGGMWQNWDAFARAVYDGMLGRTDFPVFQSRRTNFPVGLSIQLDTLPYVGVIAIAVEAETLATNRQFSGPTLTLDMAEGVAFLALDVAWRWLARGEAETVWIVESGCCALELKRVSMQDEGQYAVSECHAVLEGFSLISASISTEHFPQVYHQAFEEADISAVDVGYLEIVSEGYIRQGTAAFDALLDAYCVPFGNDVLEGAPTCALGYTSTDSPSGMWALLKVIAGLEQRFIPALPGWSGPQAPERWEATPFYVAPESRPWFLAAGATRRYAALATQPTGQAGVYAHIILSDGNLPGYPASIRRQCYLEYVACYLLPVVAEDRECLLEKLREMRQQVETSSDPDVLRALCHQVLVEIQARAKGEYILALVGQDQAELLREIDHAFEGVENAFEKGKDWQTPRGSYFTAQPLYTLDIAQRGVAFVYPGAFNSYVGLGRDLFQLFPSLYERLAAVITNVGEAVAEHRLYPRELAPWSEESKRASAEQLMQDPTALISSGTTFAMLYTMILRDLFGVSPQAALGYSLGEVSMLWASGVWCGGDKGLAAWQNSPLFKTQLAGPKLAVRKRWNLDLQEDFWKSYLLKAQVQEVQACLQNEERVYLTMVNTPGEVVIAGDPEGCQRVIAMLQCHALPVPYDSVIHNPVVWSEYEELVRLFTHNNVERPETRFYSAAGCAPLELEPETVAHTLAEMCCTPVDFPRLVQQVYDDGARIFIELGPQRTCTRWIERILRGKPHIAMPINRPGIKDVVALFGVLARLLSHGVAVNFWELKNGGWRMTHNLQLKTQNPQPTPQNLKLLEAYQYYLFPHQKQVAESHTAFLQMRQEVLRQTSALIAVQVTMVERMANQQIRESVCQRIEPQASSIEHPISSIENPPFLFDAQHLREFATGDIARCFGPEYAIFQGRRVPRIPNGALLLMSRVVQILGRRGRFDGLPTLVSEYDVPENGVFGEISTQWNGDVSGHRARMINREVLHYATLMEIALQPCGVLSAYLGSMLPYPEVDFYFRNLDGHGRLLRTVDARGKTLVNRVRLLSSMTVRGIIIQKYDFSLSYEDVTFYEGEATFGYFTPDALKNQTGLDRGVYRVPWLVETGTPALRFALSRVSPRAPLVLLDTVQIVEYGGCYGQGYVYAEMMISPQDWFFACHFYQDPVMPGSLGVEAMIQAIQEYVLRLNPHLPSDNLYFTHIPDHEVTWTYRGQITPDNRKLYLEVHIARIQADNGGMTLIGDASLWKEKLRIYEVKGVGLRMENREWRMENGE
ncbi:MAG: PfaB family protein [Anaerolineae bacterium]|nr:PfaB family protein [Anaerolineae bacterium]